MNAETLAALRGSIRKWRGIVAGRVVDQGCENCPLCQLFFLKNDNCGGCPVFNKTGLDLCGGTPYGTWSGTGDTYKTATTPELKRLAQAELDFLKSLLPKRKGKP